MSRTQLNLFEDSRHHAIDKAVEEEFWAYHAGMADGDGHFRIIKRDNSFSYSLELVDKNVVEELSSLYGVTLSVRDPKKSKRKDRFVVKRQKSYYVHLCGQNAIHFIQKIYPYMIEKRRVVENIAKIKKFNLNKFKVHQGAMFYWLAGYFDAEGSIIFNHKAYIKDKKTYGMRIALRWVTTDYKVARYVRKLTNRWFSKKSDKPVVTISKSTKNRKKPLYAVVMSKTIKIFVFGKVFKDIIKIKRKQDKFSKLIDYGNFCAKYKFKFGKVNFAKDKKRRDRWLEGIKSDLE
tara:strand:- start:40 stop:912 length:873 start_codon:yes stop_codon:yes gene_type:complete